MAKRHDESKDLIRVSRVCGIDYTRKEELPFQCLRQVMQFQKTTWS